MLYTRCSLWYILLLLQTFKDYRYCCYAPQDRGRHGVLTPKPALCHYFYDKIVPTRRGIIVIEITANIEHHVPDTFLSSLDKILNFIFITDLLKR